MIKLDVRTENLSSLEQLRKTIKQDEETYPFFKKYYFKQWVWNTLTSCGIYNRDDFIATVEKLDKNKRGENHTICKYSKANNGYIYAQCKPLNGLMLAEVMIDTEYPLDFKLISKDNNICNYNVVLRVPGYHCHYNISYNESDNTIINISQDLNDSISLPKKYLIVLKQNIINQLVNA